MEKVSLCGREALTGLQRELDTRSIERVSLAGHRMEKVSLSSREALADIRWELNTRGIEWASLANRKKE